MTSISEDGLLIFLELMRDNPENLRVIKTARTELAINAAAKKGLRPLVKLVKPSSKVQAKVGVFQDPKTGEIHVTSDYRSAGRRDTMVIDWTYYYQYHFPNPFAAYLLPQDIAIGEEVWLEDLIEDVVAQWGSQGHNPRLPAAPAIWNGSQFEIQFDEQRDAPRLIG